MSTPSDGGKGSDRRPGKGYQDNWDKIFGNKKPAPQVPAKPSAPYCTLSAVQGEVQ